MTAMHSEAEDHTGRGGGDPLSHGAFDGKYLLGREIGSGAAGTVYEAEHLVVGKKVAIKILHPSLARDETLCARFVGEARAAARIDHPNVVDIYDYGVTAGGTPYLVMELLRGETLEQILDRRGALPPALASELMVQILAGLGAAHALGIVHRDLKPANIVVTYVRPDSPLVKVLDFGIAKGVLDPALRADEGFMGTPLYMSPEQALGHEVDERSDIYAAGVILYEMLAGGAPFGGAVVELIRRVVAGQYKALSAVNPAVPRLLALAVSAAMALDPDRRLQSAHDFARQLTPYLSHPPPHSVPSGPRSAEAFLLRSASSAPEIRLMSEAPEGSRPPRDFPSLQLAKIDGMPHGEALADSLLQSPIIPRAPATPKIQVSRSKDVERWSNAPTRARSRAQDEEEDERQRSEPLPPRAAPQAAPQATPRAAAADALDLDDWARPNRGSLAPASTGAIDRPHPPLPAPLRRAAWAAAFGVGLGAALAWLYHLG
jgi:serine/threonine protein kinase